MKLLILRYRRERAHDDRERAAGFRQAAEKILNLPGPIWKLSGYDDEQCVATSTSLFDSESNARAWGDVPMVPALSAHPGISNIEVRYFDVDQERSTGGLPAQSSTEAGCARAPVVHPKRDGAAPRSASDPDDGGAVFGGCRAAPQQRC